MTNIPRLGTRVRVERLMDSCGNPHLLGRVGVVTGLRTGKEKGGPLCGESPEDPFVMVTFTKRNGTMQRDGFWIEELDPA